MTITLVNTFGKCKHLLCVCKLLFFFISVANKMFFSFSKIFKVVIVSLSLYIALSYIYIYIILFLYYLYYLQI